MENIEKTKVKVRLTIESESLEPQDVTKELDIVPTISWKKGDIIKADRKRAGGSWTVSLEAEESYDITIQLGKLYELIKGKEDKIRAIKEYCEGTIIISVIIEVENREVPGIVIEEKFSELVVKMGAEIDIDIYMMS